MTKKIKRFAKISNFGIFQNFDWNSSVKKNGNTLHLTDTNILYGRNYSGKTTLSRITRSLERGELPPRVDAPQFSVEFDDGTYATESDLTSHGVPIRVFNSDFVKENLRFVIDEEGEISPFAIVGGDNTPVVAQISSLEKELGNIETEGCLLKTEAEQKETAEQDLKAKEDAEKELNAKLREKASEIKDDGRIYDTRYNITKIRSDITQISEEKLPPLSEQEVADLVATINEGAKDPGPKQQLPNANYPRLKGRAEELLSREVSASKSLEDLLNNPELQEWVREGRAFHEGHRSTCAFCRNVLPVNLGDILDGHFNQQSEDLRSDIKKLTDDIDKEIKAAGSFFPFATESFYAHQQVAATSITADRNTAIENYINALKDLKRALDKRLANIFQTVAHELEEWTDHEFTELQGKLNNLIDAAKKHTSSLKEAQTQARNRLKLSEVARFMVEISYAKMEADLSKLEETHSQSKQKLEETSQKVSKKQTDLQQLYLQIRDERKGAERVNEYLQSYFGHDFLRLEAVEENTHNEPESGTDPTTTKAYRFQVKRGGNVAYNLSEGECSLLAFCYFIARLDDAELGGQKPIIWIDDPISSLDSNHVFFIFSLIKSEVIIRDRAEQLFVSTHNLNFLKYMKRLHVSGTPRHLLVERTENTSNITAMPEHLQKYATEFNYLFHQIYKCSTADLGAAQSQDIFYNFGNNLRSFLEMFLYFKYPDVGANRTGNNLERFLGEGPTAKIILERIANEYSHLDGAAERAMTPIDIPEMQSAAQFLLTKIQENDPDQYESLLKSIGVEPETEAA